jgi:putative methionine-R-sulfoxide reductase with GAF domain
MTLSHQDDKPWKTDLARKAAERREHVARELEEVIAKAPSFEDALREAVELMKKRFARYSAVTAYVADGEDQMVVGDLASSTAWAAVGLASGSAMVAPVRTDAGLWAILEVWSDFRDAFSPPDSRLLGKVAHALARKTPAA